MEDKRNNQEFNPQPPKDNMNKINDKKDDDSVQDVNKNFICDSPEKKTIIKITDLFSNICDDNTNEYKNENNKLEKPFLIRNPSISIKDYLERLYKYTKMNSSTIILILIYIDRLCNINKFKLTYYNIHKLILSSMVVAIKYNEDEYYPMKIYAKLGGISKAEMCFLEYYFVSLIKFNLFVTKELFDKYNDYISSSDEEEENEDEMFGEISDNKINENNSNDNIETNINTINYYNNNINTINYNNNKPENNINTINYIYNYNKNKDGNK
jgi:hypothetical protein